MAKRRIAIVGLGMVVDTHVRSLVDLKERAEIAAAFSPTEARRSGFAARWPDVPVVDNLDAIVSDASIDAVIVLTPAASHLEVAKRCAEAGKHVLLEKPVEITTARAEQLVETCERAGVTLGIVFQYRFREAAMRLRAVIESGKLGALVGASASIRLWRPQSYYDEPGRGTLARDGGGVLITQAIHPLDLLLSLTGPVAEVTGFAKTSALHQMETEDLVAAAWCFANGAIGSVDATTAAYPGAPERLEFIFEKGTASLVGTGLDIRWLDGSTESVAPASTTGGTGADPMAFPHQWHRRVIADFLDALDEGRPPAVTGREALRVHRLIDALIEAGKSGRTVAVRE